MSSSNEKLLKQKPPVINHLKSKITYLINRFQNIDFSRTNPEHTANQPNFNGHLCPYLDKIKRIIDEERDLAEQNAPQESAHITDKYGMLKIRQRIMKKFFDFYNLAS